MLDKPNCFEYMLIDMEELIKEFRQFLNERDMRLAQASILLRCSTGTLSKFLNGKTKPQDRILYRIKQLINFNDKQIPTA